MEAPESRKSSVPIWIEKTFSGGREHGSVVDDVLDILSFSRCSGSLGWHSQLQFEGCRGPEQSLELNITY